MLSYNAESCAIKEVICVLHTGIIRVRASYTYITRPVAQLHRGSEEGVQEGGDGEGKRV